MKLPIDIIWFAVAAAFVLMAAALYWIGKDAAPILTVGVPSLLALCGVDRWITNRPGPPS